MSVAPSPVAAPVAAPVAGGPPTGPLSLLDGDIVADTSPTGPFVEAVVRRVARPSDKLIVHYHDREKNTHTTHLVTWKVSPDMFHGRQMIRVCYGRGSSEDIPIGQLHLRLNEGRRRATPGQLESRDTHNAKKKKPQKKKSSQVKVGGSKRSTTGSAPSAAAGGRRPKKKSKKEQKEYSVDRFLYTMTPTDGTGEKVRVRWTGAYTDEWIPKADVVNPGCLKNLLNIEPSLFNGGSSGMSSLEQLLQVSEGQYQKQVEQDDIFAAFGAI